MAPNFLTLATTLENLGARRLLAKKVNFVPCDGSGNYKLIECKGDSFVACTFNRFIFFLCRCCFWLPATNSTKYIAEKKTGNVN